MARKKRFSNEEFLGGVYPYLSMEARMFQGDAAGKPVQAVPLEDLEENRFYHFNADAVSAFCHGVNDLAMEEANGQLIALFPSFGEFGSQRELYSHLGVTLDRVEVGGTGRLPVRIRRVRFRKTACRDYRLTLLQSRRVRVLFVVRQSQQNDGEGCGFYSFDGRLIKRVRQEVDDVLAGKSLRLPEYQRLRAIEQAAKQIETAFAREKAAMNQAFRRLQFERSGYDALHCTSDLEKGLSRLTQLKRQLPDMLSGAGPL